MKRCLSFGVALAVLLSPSAWSGMRVGIGVGINRSSIKNKGVRQDPKKVPLKDSDALKNVLNKERFARIAKGTEKAITDKYGAVFERDSTSSKKFIVLDDTLHFETQLGNAVINKVTEKNTNLQHRDGYDKPVESPGLDGIVFFSVPKRSWGCLQATNGYVNVDVLPEYASFSMPITTVSNAPYVCWDDFCNQFYATFIERDTHTYLSEKGQEELNTYAAQLPGVGQEKEENKTGAAVRFFVGYDFKLKSQRAKAGFFFGTNAFYEVGFGKHEILNKTVDLKTRHSVGFDVRPGVTMDRFTAFAIAGVSVTRLCFEGKNNTSETEAEKSIRAFFKSIEQEQACNEYFGSPVNESTWKVRPELGCGVAVSLTKRLSAEVSWTHTVGKSEVEFLLRGVNYTTKLSSQRVLFSLVFHI